MKIKKLPPIITSILLIILILPEISCQNTVVINPMETLDQRFTNFDASKISKVKESISKGDIEYQTSYQKLISDAEQALKKDIVTVMDKTQVPPSGDKHDYLSLAPYFWPDPTKTDGLPWIRRDGEVNPLTRGNNVDEPTKDKFFTAINVLTTAYLFSEDERYAKRAKEWLLDWFVNPSTKLNPNINFGQGIPGVNTGRPFGVIEFGGMISVVSGIEILRSKSQLSTEANTKINQWFTDYLTWLQTSKLGLEEKNTKNNHGTHYDTQVICYLNFLGKDAEAKAYLETVKSSRIDPQISADGSQPAELARTKSLSYSTMNLQGFTKLAYYGKRNDVDLWNYQAKNGGSIKKAYEFLQPFASGSKKWTDPQLGNLADAIERLNLLIRTAGGMMEDKSFCSLAIVPQNYANDSLLMYPCSGQEGK